MPLVARIDQVMVEAKIPYKMIFVDDLSTDKTVEILEGLKSAYPIKIFKKQGKIGKAYSIMEGVRYSDSEFVVMLDADLQYPPEAIPEMYAKAADYGVVVGNRKSYKASFLRKFVSRAFNFGFGKLLHGFKVDVQSGLKLFKREILDFVEEKDITPWTLDLSLLNTARNLGFKIGSVDITFDKRTGGHSKVNLFRTSTEIGKNALKLKFKNKKTYLLKPVHKETMAGAGFVHNKQWFRTHTTLKPQQSALQSFKFSQVIFILLVIIALEVGFIFSPITTLISIVGVLSFIYFIDVLFNLYVVLKSLHFPPEIVSTDEEIAALKDEELPVYTILCPLYREEHIVPYFLEAVAKLDYPKNKLDVKLLLEEDDERTIEVVKGMVLPKYVSAVIVPESQPKTKPKACNYGLNFATGEYLVVYDAEDQPEPDQLKKAYLAFKKSKSNIVCLQAKLNYFNPHQNLLTRFFTAEYSLWFDVMLTGLQSIDTVIPLGGTSNHFKTKTLIELEGWDPFNVTEDCDLGVRLFKRGYKTAIIDSTTLEEANSNPKNWLRQRSRWIKGYMQTYLVHMRKPFEFAKDHGWHALVFQLIIGARISFMLINPILWATTFAYFAFYAYTAPFIESLYPTAVFYFAVFSLLAGNFLYLYNYMIGSAKRGHWGLMKYVYLIPVYWLMASTAAVIALYQLVVKPHYWEKTIHGLHLDKTALHVKEKVEEEIKDITEEVIKDIPVVTAGTIGISWYWKLGLALSSSKAFFTSLIFLALTFLAGGLNLIFNVYLGRSINFENLSLVTLISGLFYFSGILQVSLFNTVTSKVGFLEGKNKPDQSLVFFKKTAQMVLFASYIISGIWLLSLPFLKQYFHTTNILPFLIFTPVWTFGIISSLFKGFLSGKLSLTRVGILSVFEPVIKIGAAFGLITLGFSGQVYLVIPLAIVVSSLLAVLFCLNLLKFKPTQVQKRETAFPIKFFFASSISVLAPAAFLSLDVLLAKHFLTPIEAGKYALISLVGKIIFFLGGIISQLILPLVSRNEGANKKSDRLLASIFILTFLITGAGFLFWGKLAYITAPIVFGAKALEVIPYLEPFTFAMICFSLSQVFVSYYLAKKNYTFPIVSFLLAIVQFALISFNHSGLEAIVFDMFLLGLLNLLVMSILHFSAFYVSIFERNVTDFLNIFSRSLPFETQDDKRLKILVFNWRDIKHKWAGGAENYIHELSKIWVKKGCQVTIFCGNDTHNPRYEVIDGVQIVRRGGFYMVYFWAFLYYIFRFRGKFDLVIDSENGIPFFTPLYVSKSKLLLIHHIHQEVFRNHLPWHLATMASFLEGKFMPFVYKKQRVVTVSNSSKIEIQKLGKNVFDEVEIVNPGIHNDKFLTLKKTKQPSFLYLGRLQPYKNIEIAVKAFVQVVEKYKDATLTIAGYGESLEVLKKLAADLKIEESIHFTGKVSEDEKYKLLAQSWVMVQPSMIEGWGITVIEANASGTPVIASNVNGLRDSVIDGKTGLLIKPKDEKAFAKAMIDLIEDKDFRNYLSEQGKKWALGFRWENSANKFLTMIEDTVTTTNLEKVVLGRLYVEG